VNLEDQLKRYRLSHEEYERIERILGRPPHGVEWALFSALWSEHCSYKSSKIHLRKFKYRSKRVLQSFGENAGVIDLGEGERIAFKMESHNHPSFIEPYQGAATGVGGILRDIFTMGARPIALGDYLCFGDPAASRMQTLIDGVVRGISGYGNCVGVPTITGQVEFHSSYNTNILVNVFALGLFRPDEPVVTSAAHGPGNYVVYVGAKTGRDGIHGASMASESFSEESASKRPTVQIGDPFYEKLLIESCLEVIQKHLVVAIQDMGAAGLTSSSFEMAAKGKVGLRLDLDKVPLRDSTLTPEDILLSESQERMLLICEPKNYREITRIFGRWGLDAQVIGEVTESTTVELWWKGEQICSMDPKYLTDEAPQYDRTFSSIGPLNRVEELPVKSDHQLPMGKVADSLLAILSDPRGTSRMWVYRQYDQRVGAKTVADAGESVAVQRLPDTGRGLGIVLGCRPHVMRLDPRDGGLDSVIYPALELAAKGFESVGLTDCLNFGNPERPALMSEFVAAVEGLSEASQHLKIPVISGNVSFYNETLGHNITSTPATGLVGVRDSVRFLPSSAFSEEGDEVFLVRQEHLVWTGMESEREGVQPKAMGRVDAEKSLALVQLLLALPSHQIRASRVVGKFGLLYALARMCLGGMGCVLEVPTPHRVRRFYETMYEVLIVVPSEVRPILEAKVQSVVKDGVQMYSLGRTGGDRLLVHDVVNIGVNQLREAYEGGWKKNVAR